MPNDPVVHVIDDDDAARESLEFLLRSAKLKVRTYDSAKVFLEDVPILTAGCIITDVRMPDVSGIDLLRRLREMNSSVPVIVITGHGDVPLAVEAMRIGAIDFLEKPYDDDVLLAAVQLALSEGDKAGARDIEKAELTQRLATLSAREREVLEGLVAGQPNKIIAFNLGISPRTVEIYRANVMTKMKAASLSDLVRMALVANIAPAQK
ncbi:MAG TPA: response regulator FixJ [Xanthobacteraceae bacterium]|nr:response regulator FixJ [Xanthobacteraceae bacterium]